MQLYDNLPSRSIRLLRVHARDANSEDDAPLRCDLFVASLTSTPAYAALSYVWGDSSSPPDYIFCNGHHIGVTRNCYLALRHLRSINGSFQVWVDAICINQRDQDDKREQINLMADIYSQAQITYIWLGEGTTSSNRVVGYLRRTGFLEQFLPERRS